jgi:hypothetical protein
MDTIADRSVRLVYIDKSDVIDYATLRRRSDAAGIRVYDEAGTERETHEHAGEFKEP